jgi:hypothetical protein
MRFRAVLPERGIGGWGQAAGREFLIRKNALTVNQDAEVSDKVGPAQITAIAA